MINLKPSFILLELIITIVITSIIFLISTNYLFILKDKNNSEYKINLTKIEFETTRLFILNKLHIDKDLKQLKYQNNNLYYKDNLLQNNVTSFTISNKQELYTIDICIELYDNICQQWIIK